jgi:hypothetical protein
LCGWINPLNGSGGYGKEINTLPVPRIELLFLDHSALTQISAHNTLLKLVTRASESEMLLLVTWNLVFD